ncbi:hypothetical protein GW17_00014967 [Ensete ventricosum]|nr:hypothetical protein GW17_00014967 [Ensete ventricosum]
MSGLMWTATFTQQSSPFSMVIPRQEAGTRSRARDHVSEDNANGRRPDRLQSGKISAAAAAMKEMERQQPKQQQQQQQQPLSYFRELHCKALSKAKSSAARREAGSHPSAVVVVVAVVGVREGGWR